MATGGMQARDGTGPARSAPDLKFDDRPILHLHRVAHERGAHRHLAALIKLPTHVAQDQARLANTLHAQAARKPRRRQRGFPMERRIDI